MVTANGSPSGMAITIIAIAMITASRSSVQSLLSILKSKVNGLHSGTGWQLKGLVQPHGITSVISSMILIKVPTKVKPANANPRLPN